MLKPGRECKLPREAFSTAGGSRLRRIARQRACVHFKHNTEKELCYRVFDTDPATSLELASLPEILAEKEILQWHSPTPRIQS